MPLQGFWTAVLASLILQIVPYRLLNSHGRGCLARSFPAHRSVRCLRLSTARHGGALCGETARRGLSVYCFLLCSRLRRQRSFFRCLQGRDNRRGTSSGTREWGRAIRHLFRLPWQDKMRDLCIKDLLWPYVLCGLEVDSRRPCDTPCDTKRQDSSGRASFCVW